VVVTGNLKMELGPAGEGVGGLWRRLLELGDDPVWIAGSTHHGEEATALDVLLRLRQAGHRVRLVLAPRHPERSGDVEALARARGLATVRRSRIGGSAGDHGDVILLDTIGELAALYAVADVIFVGGSLVPVGGHNVIEPALCGKPVIFGPHMANFREAAALLLDGGGAIQVADARGLEEALRALLGDPGVRAARGRAAWESVRAHQGACERTLAALESVLAPEG
jgi:3-deoxy-D-manno-octulosonic-acid transferase